MKILIKNCDLISMDESREKLEKGIDILIENDRIKCIDKNIAENCDKVIDATGKIVMPGLINTHAHVPMSLFKENLDGYTLQEWLNEKIWPAEAKLTDEEVYKGSIDSFREMIRTGTTTILDMYFMQNNIIKAAKDTFVRLEVNRTLIDVDGDGELRFTEMQKMMEEEKDLDTDLIQFDFGPHGFYTCTKDYVERISKFARGYNKNLQLHFCENSGEVNDIKKMHGVNTPGEVLEKHFAGLNMILAHCVKVSDEDIKIIKKLNMSVAHCPVSNLKLGCGIAPISKMQKEGINVSLGTDGQGSGSNLDMFEAMKFAALLQKGVNENPTLMGAYDVIKMATINGAKAIRRENELGSLEVNKKADLIIIDMDSEVIQPINNIFASIVYNVKGNDVDTTIVNGKILMENKKVLV